MGRKPKQKLSDQRRRFVAEYLVDQNGTRAAVRAGYSKRSAHVTATRLLKDANVRAAIDARFDRRIKRTDITGDRVVLELARIVFADVLNYVSITDRGIAARLSSELTEDQARAIAEVSESIDAQGNRRIKYKLHDKTRAADLLSKLLGMQVTRSEVTGRGGGPVRVEATTIDEDRAAMRDLLTDPEGADLLRALAKKAARDRGETP